VEIKKCDEEEELQEKEAERQNLGFLVLL